MLNKNTAVAGVFVDDVVDSSEGMMGMDSGVGVIIDNAASDSARDRGQRHPGESWPPPLVRLFAISWEVCAAGAVIA